MKAYQATTIQEYISFFPEDTQELLWQIYQTIKEAAPDAEEMISYQMPAFKYYGPLVYFAGYQNHIGFYPTASGISNFQAEIASYKSSKGAIQFPIDQPMPIKLIRKITMFRVKENKAKAALKAKKK